MTGNQLKTIACISMLIDHIGFFLLPEIEILRYIGRLAMPIFSFFIAEGCKYTHSKTKYFLQLFVLAVLCQSAYIIEGLINGNGKITSVYLNVLFTFSLSVVECSALLKLIESFIKKDPRRIILNALFFIFTSLFILYLCSEPEFFGLPVIIDYGIAGIIVPLFTVISRNAKKQFVLFFAGIIVYNLLLFGSMPYIWYSLLTLPLILLYNGTRGNPRFKAAFYAFYPLHFLLIYSIKLIAF